MAAEEAAQYTQTDVLQTAAELDQMLQLLQLGAHTTADSQLTAVTAGSRSAMRDGGGNQVIENPLSKWDVRRLAIDRHKVLLPALPAAVNQLIKLMQAANTEAIKQAMLLEMDQVTCLNHLILSSRCS